MDFSGARLHSIPVLMYTHKLMKAVFGKTGRSGFHQFLTSVLFINRSKEAGFDVLGGIIVVSLSVGTVLLMRFLLAN
jgi:hypothetical protein